MGKKGEDDWDGYLSATALRHGIPVAPVMVARAVHGMACRIPLLFLLCFCASDSRLMTTARDGVVRWSDAHLLKLSHNHVGCGGVYPLEGTTRHVNTAE
jgi:hypothetical protein